ncbi:hypothetical protein AB0D35_15530 [Streptomyces sp. NPDC048301]|uniref:hypothetical protein n=1 Tax=Streptomyces sp. NPDC048301 TaxID=3155631 RepID=UPI00342C630B
MTADPYEGEFDIVGSAGTGGADHLNEFISSTGEVLAGDADHDGGPPEKPPISWVGRGGVDREHRGAAQRLIASTSM